MAQTDVIKTQKACILHHIKKDENDFLVSLNLLSCPSLKTLENKKSPSRNAQIMISNERIILLWSNKSDLVKNL